jgi:hypothetical protein
MYRKVFGGMRIGIVIFETLLIYNQEHYYDHAYDKEAVEVEQHPAVDGPFFLLFQVT